jgi:hypothetical protein
MNYFSNCNLRFVPGCKAKENDFLLVGITTSINVLANHPFPCNLEKFFIIKEENGIDRKALKK